MPTRKQEIYCRLLYDGILELRMICSGGEWGTDEKVLAMRDQFQYGNDLANFLHRVPGSILEPRYVANDITFINVAFPCHIERFGNRLGAETAALMLEFYEGVPDELRAQLSWHPSAEFRSLAEQKDA